MSMKIRFPGAALVVAILMFAPTAALSRPVSVSVEPGDVLQIEVYAGGEKQNDFSATVSPDYTIMCPLIGSVEVDSAGTTGISVKIRAILARDYYVDPQVMVSVKEHAIFSLSSIR